MELRGKTVKVYTRPSPTGPKKFIRISGYAGLRRILTASRYGATNVKVFSLTANHLTLKELGARGWQNLEGLLTGSRQKVLMTVVLTVDTIQWLANDENHEGERLVAKWVTSLIGITITAILAPFVTAAVLLILKLLFEGTILTTASVAGLIVGSALVYLGYKFDKGMNAKVLGSENSEKRSIEDVIGDTLKQLEQLLNDYKYALETTDFVVCP